MPSASLGQALPRAASLGALVELTKPSIAALVMVTALSGALLASEPLNAGRLVIALVSTALVVGAANALNMYVERESDALMRRTRKRPLPTGRLSPDVALGFALFLATLGLNALGVVAGGLAFALTALAFVSYVFVYTPLKRISPIALYVGALPGALPPLIGYASATGEIGVGALFLFAFLFVWQLPHFAAIATFRAEDYRAAGMRVVSVARGLPAARRLIAGSSLLLGVLALAPPFLGMVESAYLFAAVPVTLGFVGLAVAGPWFADQGRWARRVFFASMPYLVSIYAAFVSLAG